MDAKIITTKEELKKAMEDKAEEILVVGKLADDLRATKQITTLGATTLGILSTAIAAGMIAAPFTAGTSLGISALAAAPIAVTTGVSIPAIILASALGIGIIISLHKDYREVEFGRGMLRMRLKK